jgi:hypothetical protein
MPPEPKMLLPSQQRTALEICGRHRVPSHQFEWVETVNGDPEQLPRVHQLRDTSTGYSFTFDFYPAGNMLDISSPGENERIHKSGPLSQWSSRWKNVEAWAEYLAREIDALQFLETAMHDAPTLQRYSLESTDNDPFAPDEIKILLARLQAVENRVLEAQSFNASEAQFVREQFDHLRREASTAGRGSGFQMTIGVMVSIIAAFFQGDAARQLWQFLGSQFNQFLRIGRS